MFQSLVCWRVLKDIKLETLCLTMKVSILGMLEGVKRLFVISVGETLGRFNPWYVGGC